MKGITKTIKNETKDRKGGFSGMLLDTLGASLLGNMLTGKRMLRAGYGIKEGKGILRAGYRSKNIFNSTPSFNKYCQSEPRFNGVCSRDNLPHKIKDGTYVINPDEYADLGAHWIALYALNNDVIFLIVLGLNNFL